VRTLLVDNHDSYTYNLFQLMAQVYGAPPLVLTNDDPRWATLRVDSVDAVVVSPGPGHPAVPGNLGAARGVLEQAAVPVLGVCLGHQAIALLAGAEVVGAPRPRHGHLTTVRHVGRGLFDGLPQDFVAVRYHSLCVRPDTLPPTLEPTAWAEDGVLMGLRRRDRPSWGVQFHPESISTEHGARLLENFGRLAVAEGAPARRRPVPVTGPARPGPAAVGHRPAWRVLHRELGHAVDTPAAFAALFGDLDHAFWLDSSRAEPGLSRFSFLGAPAGPDGEVLTYALGSGLTVRTAAGTTHVPGSVLDALQERLGEPLTGAPDVPFDLTGGYVGYLGYEMKGELGSPNRHVADTPDAVWMSTTRMVVVDHETGTTHLLAMTRRDGDAAARAWIGETAARLDGLGPPPPAASPSDYGGYDLERGLVDNRQAYLDRVDDCHRYLTAGESYEICLTTRVELPPTTDPLRVYLAQRRANPAPYAAFLRLGRHSVLCSSPERFLRIGADRDVVTKPIKGTAPRGRDPVEDDRLRTLLSADPKTRAENLMIVDLLRNDLGRVCEIGSVHVPAFMAVESYATVHQLVSTVRGTLRPDVDAVGCVRSCFPGGSMTGAPKRRTMELIDELEGTARGVYAGTIGFFAHNGTADLNIVIRTAVADGRSLRIGAGGAVVLDSDPAAEFEEMLLKAHAPVLGLCGDPQPAGGPRRPEEATR